MLLNQNKTSSYYINNWIHRLKISGYVNNLQVYLINRESIKYKILHVNTNNLIKKIIISKSRQLQIPKSLLIKYIEENLGFIYNYNKLQDSVNKIYSWYKQHGFEYVNINLIKYNNLGNVYININEGILRKIDLQCESKKYINRKYIAYIESRIKKELLILPGQTVNIKKIELGIQRLKEDKIISSCIYKILEYTNELVIMVNYSIYQDNIHYINDEDIRINKKKEVYIYNTIRHNKFILNQKYAKLLIHNFLLNLKIAYKILNKIIIFYHNSNQIDKHLDFTYVKFHTIQSYKNFIFDIKYFKNNTRLNLSISYPNYKSVNNWFINFLFQISNNEDLIYIVYPIQSIKIEYYPKLITHNHIYNGMLKFQGIHIKFHNNFINYIDLYESLDLMSKDTYVNLIYISRNNIYKTILKRNNRLLLYQILHKVIKQYIIKFNIAIKYSTFSITPYINSGTSFTCHINSLIYFLFSKLNIINLTNYMNQYMKMQYNRIFIIPKFVPLIKIYRNILILHAELYYPIIHQKYLDISFNHLKIFKSSSYIIQESHYNTVYLFDIQYHVFLNQYYSLYIFFNNTNKKYKKIQAQNHIHLYSSYQFYKYSTNVGYGVQLRIPITNIPLLRIEYCISNRDNSFFQLRIYSLHKEYNL
uniref:POTRA domain-containing protein n=1 Tax=Riquetophycus sp. TaxID=1897556 RepID=A0A1C9C834_9FLOR|nr:hypothetical protein Riqu_055 [Riquetophycus sp.]